MTSERRQILDKELELVKQEKEKLALELEVLRLRQALGPARPPTASAAQKKHKEKDHQLAAGLNSQTTGLTVYMDYDTDLDMNTKIEHIMLSQHEFFSANSSRVVVAHILASKSPQPNAHGAKIPISSPLNISVWRHYLTDYVDHVVVNFL